MIGGNNVDTFIGNFYPMSKFIFLFRGYLVPNLNPPPPPRPPGGLCGRPETQKGHFSTFITFFFTKPIPEPKLGGLGGQAGFQKIGVNPPTTLKKQGQKRPTRFHDIPLFDNN